MEEQLQHQATCATNVTKAGNARDDKICYSSATLMPVGKKKCSHFTATLLKGSVFHLHLLKIQYAPNSIFVVDYITKVCLFFQTI